MGFTRSSSGLSPENEVVRSIGSEKRKKVIGVTGANKFFNSKNGEEREKYSLPGSA